MKKLLLILVILPLIVSAKAFAKTEKGAFLLTKSVNLLEGFKKDDKRHYTQRRSAFAVVDIYENEKKEVFFQIIFPFLEEQVNGSGYVIENDEELKKIEFGNVKVYKTVPESFKKFPEFISVPVNNISFTGNSSTSHIYPEITWRAVDYKAKLPKTLWVPADAGIYRPDKSAEWLNAAWKTIYKNKYKYSIRKSMLLGLVEVGFTKEQVILTIGEPSKKNEKPETKDSEWIYPDKKIIFKEDTVKQVL